MLVLSSRAKSHSRSGGPLQRVSLVVALVLAGVVSLSVDQRSAGAAASWTVTTIPSIGNAPLGSSADGSLLYVALRDAFSVAVVDTSNDSKAVFASGFAAAPRHIAMIQSGSDAIGMVVGCCAAQADSSQRFLRSGGGAPVLTNGPIAGNFQGVAMLGEYALVVEDDSTATVDKLRIIDARANTLTATLELREAGGGPLCTTQCRPRQIEIVGSTAYVALVDVDKIAVIDVTDPTAPTQGASLGAGDGPRDVYARAGRLFVPNQIGDDVWIYDLADLTAVPTKVDVGDTPVAVAADAKYAYVVNQGSNSVSAIDLADGTVVGTLTVGASPVSLTEVSGSFYVSNIDGDSLSKITRTTLSSDASLSGLSVSEGSLSPVFASGTTSYAVGVGNGVSSVSFTPTVTDAGASVTVDGVAVGSGVASAAVALAVGANVVDVVVTAEDGSTRTYTVTVTRAALSSDASLSGLSVSEGSLSPVFASGTTSYAVGVGNGVSSVSFTPTVTDAGASVTVDGVAVGSGVASAAVALAVGANVVDVVVTAEDGSTRTYTVTVTRASVSSPEPSLPAVDSGSPELRCGPAMLQVGGEVVCEVLDGAAGIDILWRAAYNPVFADAGVTLDETGRGEFSFVVPAAAAGRELTVELVEWLEPLSLGVVGGPVPLSVPSGGGPVRVWPLVLLAVAGGLVLRRMATASVSG